MTTPRYPMGCAAGSQVRGVADPDLASDYAWNVNLHHGNSNINNRNNHGCALVCRPVPGVVSSPRECQGAKEIEFSLMGGVAEWTKAATGDDSPTRASGAKTDEANYPDPGFKSQRHPSLFSELHTAWRAARKQKRLSSNQLRFEARLEENLLTLEEQLNGCIWLPQPTLCFVAQKPKAREIHAPDFSDRVVHHWLIPQLEARYERVFIHHSYANRKGKGTHAAVAALTGMVRQVASGQGGGYFLQLDIKNFFVSLPRDVLWRLLKRAMERWQLPAIVQRTVHALLRRSAIEQGVIHRATAAERDQVPWHKRLENAPAQCGLPIGNLSSQFFANVLLNELDQFVKHTLKVPRYVRYVDDFVLVHESREQLAAWRDAIEAYLRTELRLELKAEQHLRPLASGIDFLGYVIRPTHTLVRPRVVQHLRDVLASFERRHVAPKAITATPAQLQALGHRVASYQGHLAHATSWRLRQSLHRKHPWLHAATGVRRRFHHRAVGPITIKVY